MNQTLMENKRMIINRMSGFYSLSFYYLSFYRCLVIVT